MKLKKLVSACLAAALIIGSVPFSVFAEEQSLPSSGNDVTVSDSAAEAVTGDIGLDFEVKDKWAGGFNGEITVNNLTDDVIENWQIQFDFPQEITNIWNAKIVSCENGIYNIKNAGGNNNVNIPANGNVTFGFTGLYSDEIVNPSNAKLAVNTEKAENEAYSVKYELLSDWGSGYSAQITIINNTDTNIEGWHLAFDYGRKIENIWNAVIADTTDNGYYISNAEYNSVIPANSSVTFGFNGSNGYPEDEPQNYSLTYVGNEISNTDISDVDYESDTDEDGLPDWIEGLLETDINSADTDGDGISDYNEVMLIGTDPLKYDTDDNGICDIDEDCDNDKLTNGYELEIGTNAADKDTDSDGLTDYDELYIYHTDPLKYDTDNDTLSDGDEVKLGLNPNRVDTDGNGINDCDEKIMQTIEKEISCADLPGITDVSVSIAVSGLIDDCTEIENMYNKNILSTELVGISGAPTDITCTQAFDSAEVAFTYDESKLKAAPENLGVLWFNEDEQFYEVTESSLDKENHKIVMNTTHFSEYTVVDLNEWFAAWDEKINYAAASANDINSDWNSKLVTAQQLCDEYNNCFGYENKLELNGILPICEYGDIYARTACVDVEVNTGDVLSYDCLFLSIYPFDELGLRRSLLSDNSYAAYPVPICNGWVASVLRPITMLYTIPDYDNDNHWPRYSDIESIDYQFYGKYLVPSGQVDTTDNDNDGIYDIYELTGMRIANGQVIYTKTNNADTDGDGLKDGEEIIRQDTERGYFVIKSNPVLVDSDCDKILDNYISPKVGYYEFSDPNPLISDIELTDLKNDFFSVDYEYIEGANKNWTDDHNGSKIESYGGYQGWFGTYGLNESDKIFCSGTVDGHTIHNYGCGLIACADVLLYMSITDPKYNPTYVPNIGIMDLGNNYTHIKFRNYLLYVMMLSNYFKIYPEPFNGIPADFLPFSMEQDINFISKINKMDLKAKWAPAGLADDWILESFKYKIGEENIPIIFSYFSMTDDKLQLYRLNNLNYVSAGQNYAIKSHYMVATGVVEYSEDVAKIIGHETMIKVATFGEKFYVDYEAYSDKISLATNFMTLVKETEN